MPCALFHESRKLLGFIEREVGMVDLKGLVEGIETGVEEFTEAVESLSDARQGFRSNEVHKVRLEIAQAVSALFSPQWVTQVINQANTPDDGLLGALVAGESAIDATEEDPSTDQDSEEIPAEAAPATEDVAEDADIAPSAESSEASAETLVGEASPEITAEAPAADDTGTDLAITPAETSATDAPATDPAPAPAETPATETTLSARLGSIISDYHLEDGAYYQNEQARASATAIRDLAAQLDGLDDTRKAMASELISKWHSKMALSQTDELVGEVHQALILGLEGILHSSVEGLTEDQIKEQLAASTEVNAAQAALAYPQAGDYLERVVTSYGLAGDDARYDVATQDTGQRLLPLATQIKALPAETQKTLEADIYAWHSAMASDQTNENVLRQNEDLFAKLNALIASAAAAETPEAAEGPAEGDAAAGGTDTEGTDVTDEGAAE